MPDEEIIERPVADHVEQGGATFVQSLVAATNRASDYRRMCDQDHANQRGAAREFSLAVTALEEARMRFTRGYAMLSGRYNPADLEAIDLAAEMEADHHG